MNLEELAQQLQGKKRSIADLARFVSTRTDQNPNYTLLLGAGCSVTSGIRSATTLINEWRKEICGYITDPEEQRLYLKQKCGDWYDPNREYSSLFEKKYDLQRQRRMFVEKEVAGKMPSLGYAYLTSLVGQNYFQTIFTTNFDDLINEAFYLFSDHRPIVCAHDSSINSVTVTSKRPKIIKLHGDYLFDDLKSTARETESLEQNMKSKFSEFARDYGLIVIGYAGGDRSIMDVISTLLKNEDYFKGGIYWCLRKDAEIGEELRKLLWKEKVYFVEIDGFDELFAELHSSFNNGDVLPISTVSVTRRPGEIVGKLLANQSKFPSASPILNQAIEKLSRQSKRTTLMDMVWKTDREDTVAKDDDTLSDDELITQIELQNLVSSGGYRDAILQGKKTLRSDARPSLKVRVLKSTIQAHRCLEETNEAVAVSDELIALQPFDPSHRLFKAEILEGHSQKLEAIEKAIAIAPYFVKSYARKATLYQDYAANRYGDARKEAIELAKESLEIGLLRDPSIKNPCWEMKEKLIDREERDEKIRDAELENIINTLSLQNPDSFRVLRMRILRLSRSKDRVGYERVLKDIDGIKQRTDKELHAGYDELRLTCLSYFADNTQLNAAILSIRSAYDLSRKPYLAVQVATKLQEKFGKDAEAIELLESCHRVELDADIFISLISAYCNMNRFDEANDLFQKHAHKFSEDLRRQLRLTILEAMRDFPVALAEYRKWLSRTNQKHSSHLLFLLLQSGAFPEAEQVARDILEEINYSPEAAAEIVNFEIARLRQNKKVNSQRLDSVLRFTSCDRTKAAVYSLLSKKTEMIQSIKAVMEADKTFRFEALEWPVFAEYKVDPDFKRAITL